MNKQNDEDHFITPPQLARLWGVKPEKIIRWIRSGELKAMDFSSNPQSGRPRFRIRMSDAEEFEMNRTVSTGPLGRPPLRRTDEAYHLMMSLPRFNDLPPPSQ
ncbi:Helix-turn-helix domain protein [Polystyrenella longa]|uniref:Helix-turn-helix domain protein n=1 Tax=Polystyrenella longa TaxID=2528007 RepID=A0A518CTS6_9PLAN|nr:helix-turn-helix domain-containing protein [Polystyrenella longa]QDU82630.1 Helix-turn-helix domain protein [Polystyrenella longa]